MFTSRSQSRSSARHLDLKVLVFGVGLLLLLLGIRLQMDWLVWVAIVPLAAAFLLRFAGRRDGEEDDQQSGTEED